MGTFLMIIVMAVFVNNFVVVQFLGICPFLGLSKRTSDALGMGIAVTLVMAITCLITYPIYNYILVPLGLEFLEIIVFIFVIASLVQMLEKAIKKLSPGLYKAMGIYLPLITTNCAVLGVAEMVIDPSQMAGVLGSATMNVGYSVLYGVFAGLGFTVAIVLLSGLREKVDYLDTAKTMKGFPVTMVTACFIAMAFYVFNLISL
ncbi:MAG: electron transport complex subunit RsxA [Clostridiales bacterium]|nr:electron transport complex subunit RsxA [Clostridiales bacterium]MDY4655586.1 Rnf-Nqr domain containing protein [Eubacteriales bacterium]